MKQNLLQETLLLSIFLHYKVKKNQTMRKAPSFKSAWRLLASLSTLRPRMPHIYDFLDCSSFREVLAPFHTFSEFGTDFTLSNSFLVKLFSLGSEKNKTKKNFSTPRFTTFQLIKLKLLQETLLLFIVLH